LIDSFNLFDLLKIEDQTHENPYGELVSKRLRTLRKRLVL